MNALRHIYGARAGLGYFGAIRLRDGKLVFKREEDKFNAVTFHTFLKNLRKVSSRSGRRGVVVTDNAKYHYARLHADCETNQRLGSS